jgi:hypothetical protein
MLSLERLYQVLSDERREQLLNTLRDGLWKDRVKSDLGSLREEYHQLKECVLSPLRLDMSLLRHINEPISPSLMSAQRRIRCIRRF